MNLDKCAFMVYFRTIVGIVVSKEGKTFDLKKIEALIKMPVSKTPQEIQVFNEIAQFYQCFIIKKKKFAPITKLFKKTEIFEWTIECQTIWEDIKNQYIQAPILINPN